MIRRPPRSTLSSSSAASDVYKRQLRSYAQSHANGGPVPMRVDEEYIAVIEASLGDPNGAVASLLALEASTPTTTTTSSPSSSSSSSSNANIGSRTNSIDLVGLQKDLSRLEWVYKMVEVYGWLSWRFGGTFMQQEETKMAKERTVLGIELALRALRIAGVRAVTTPAATHNRYGGRGGRGMGGGGGGHHTSTSPPTPVNRELRYAGVKSNNSPPSSSSVSYTHLRAHETPEHLVCRLLLEKKKKNTDKIGTIRLVKRNKYI
eukprot:TRINITY_DN40017_c0_g1_i1.p1 TRINITY_DN40017_c0_g1~~TRINITY_DN40017_c0_g1_i1.p1  ORF type:complete len:262 (+),score=47.74 TRINITY_DN40017_c0_g1_i1:117-902(+)